MSIRLDPSGNAAVGYDRFIGRYQSTVAIDFADFAEVEHDLNFGMTPPARVLDVGCGIGVLTSELLTRTAAVAAVDSDEHLLTACQESNPGADVRQGRADDLPYADAEFDIVMATRPVGAVRDLGRCLREFCRVTRPGGTVAVSAWNPAGFEMYDVFWAAARSLDPGPLAPRRSTTTEGTEAALLQANLTDLRFESVTTAASYRGFEDFWSSISFTDSPTGAYLAGLSPEHQAMVREECRTLVPQEDLFVMRAEAVFARGNLHLLAPGRMT